MHSHLTADYVLAWINDNVPDASGFSLKADTNIEALEVLDSFSIIELVTECEEHFGISVPPEEFLPENFSSVNAFAAVIDKLKT